MPCYNTAPYKHFWRLLSRPCRVYTAHAVKQRTGFCRRLSDYLQFFRRCCLSVHPAILHRLRHAGAYHSAVTPPACTRYQQHAGRCTGQHSCPIIIRYIRVRPCYGSMPDSAANRRPCQPGGVDRWQVLHPAHLLRGQRLHLYRVSPAAWTRRAARNH